MRLDALYLWYLGDPTPRYVGALKLVAAGKGVSLHYGEDWLANMEIATAASSVFVEQPALKG